MGSIGFRAAALCLIVSVVAAAGVYGVGRALRPVYQASGTIRVAVPSQGGITDPNVTAANDLATQYEQLVSSRAVQVMAASALHVPVDSLNGTISGSTVAAQNIVQVTTTAGSAGVAQARAVAAVNAVHRYLTGLTNTQNQQYLGTLSRGITRATDPPGSTAPSSPAAANERVTLMAQAQLDAAGNQPSFQVIDSSARASETSPRPKLYALVAFVVALIVSARLAFVVSRRRSPGPVQA
jgi:capsular polysaccharide biosynthesis protein